MTVLLRRSAPTFTLLVLLLPALASAQSAWVSDEFEITMRTGPSTSNAIVLMISSGTELSILEEDNAAGYTRVRTGGGTEGWVLTRYLMEEPSAREQLQNLSAQLTSANTRGSSLDSQLEGIRGEYDTATRRIETLEGEKSALESDLADIRRTAANALSLDQDNKRLRDELAAAEIRIGSLEQENRALEGQAARFWFISGAAVLVVGILLGLWLPRIEWNRRSKYDRF